MSFITRLRLQTGCLKYSDIVLKPSLLTSSRSFSGIGACSRSFQSRILQNCGVVGHLTLSNGADKSRICNGLLRSWRLVSTSNLSSKAFRRRHKTTLIYICAIGVAMVGGAYAGVPLYRIFCQATGLGGQSTQGHKVKDLENVQKTSGRILTIQFNADTASSMQWSFRPQQVEIRVAPGETALAFYRAKNPTDRPIVGISTYNIVPFEAGPYFNKIQCFCFEEQRLNPHEEVDMPVFFYIDPEIVDDPRCENLKTIMLSYTFFEAKEGFQVPVPPYLREWRTAV